MDRGKSPWHVVKTNTLLAQAKLLKCQLSRPWPRRRPDQAASPVMNSLARMFDPVMGWMARRYQAAVATELKKYGLRYEDLYDPQLNMDVDEAMKRLPVEVIDARNQRLKRAHDVSLKKHYLPKALQDKQTPYLSYIQDMLDQVEAENKERKMLGTGKIYERQLP
ncbi:hypothetical protein WJX84_004242 [Apatococcus fuscideae]|uniref:Complex III subunit VII n=1 Tax=Apatococcus fuscideae TaxID=2026836 RepID=A0AAW1T2G2_9CHLO